MSNLTDANLVEKELQKDYYRRQPEQGLLHHSDRGSQYDSHQICDLLAVSQTQVSMSRMAVC